MNAKANVLFIKLLWTQINLIMKKNITRVAVKPLLKNDPPIIKNHLTMSNIKTKRNFHKKCKILSQQITTQILPRKLHKDAPL